MTCHPLNSLRDSSLLLIHCRGALSACPSGGLLEVDVLLGGGWVGACRAGDLLGGMDHGHLLLLAVSSGGGRIRWGRGLLLLLLLLLCRWRIHVAACSVHWGGGAAHGASLGVVVHLHVCVCGLSCGLSLDLGGLGTLLAEGFGLLLLLDAWRRGFVSSGCFEIWWGLEGAGQLGLCDEGVLLGLLGRPPLKGIDIQEATDKVDEGDAVGHFYGTSASVIFSA